ncbi:hypothetical protein AALA80_05105 [Oscillospiraceae bacterium 50-60]
MKTPDRTALTPLDLCILIAHETVSLLNTDAEALDAALRLRTGLDVFAAASGLSGDAIPLLMWIDQEMEGARQFTAAEQDTPHLIDPDRLLPVPDAAAQLDAVWMLFQAVVNASGDYRQTLLETARTLTEMGGLEDMLLTTKIPAAGFLSVEDLRAELEEVRMALQPQEAEDHIAGQPAQV